MGCRPIVLGPKLIRVLRAPSTAAPVDLRRTAARDGKGRFDRHAGRSDDHPTLPDIKASSLVGR